MPYRGLFFEKDLTFHIVSRAVEGIKIFVNNEDIFRFIFQFQAANLGRRDLKLRQEDMMKAGRALLMGEEIPKNFIVQEHEPSVYLLDFSFVVNHYHFYLLINIENSVPALIQKVNNGFAKYFNLKYSRKDTLFGARYKSILVEAQFQSDAVSRYVGIINPLDVFQPGWREEGLKNLEEAFNFLENYPFSSFPDKIGKRRSKFLAPREIWGKFSLGRNKEEYANFVEDFLKIESTRLNPLFLE